MKKGIVIHEVHLQGAAGDYRDMKKKRTSPALGENGIGVRKGFLEEVASKPRPKG